MICPKCRHSLVERTVGELLVDCCTGCGGLWFDGKKIRQHLSDTLEAHGKPGVLAIIRTVRATPTNLECPACRQTYLKSIMPYGVEVERCSRCRGVFLERGEIEALAERALVDPEDLAAVAHTSLVPPAGTGRKQSTDNLLNGAATLFDFVISLII